MLRQIWDWILHGDGPRRPPAGKAGPSTRRDELLAAHNDLVHQIAILDAGPANYYDASYFRSRADELRRVLAEIDAELDALKAENGRRTAGGAVSPSS
jgi:hypothetical protein